MSAPPWVFASIVSLINAWHADKTQEKVSALYSLNLPRLDALITDL